MTALINLCKVIISWAISAVIRKPYISGMPVAVNAELTNLCNLACPECPSGAGLLSRPKGFMDISLFSKLITELKPFLLNLNLYFQGEPMLHPEFLRFISLARGIRTTVSTNGHFLTEENIQGIISSGISKLIVSLDGADRLTYLVYRRGGDFNIVFDGLKRLAEARNEYREGPEIVIQFLVHAGNEHQIPEIKIFAKENGFKLRLKSMQVIDGSFDRWLPAAERFRRYRRSGNGYTLKGRMKNRCLRLWMNPVVTWDGNVLPCCFDKDGKYVLGNLGNSSFSEIWHSEKNHRFREMVLSGRSHMDICRNCTEGLHGVNV